MENNVELTYSQALEELEQIVRKIQDNNCDIDKLSAYTSRAVELIKICKTKLFKTDEEIKSCLQELSSL